MPNPRGDEGPFPFPVGTTQQGTAVTEMVPGFFTANANTVQQPPDARLVVPDNTYTYVGRVQLTHSTPFGLQPIYGPIFYSDVTDLYYIPDITPYRPDWNPVTSYTGEGDGSSTPYTTTVGFGPYPDNPPGNTAYDYSTETETYSPPCFCPGTLIMTANGEAPVERLAIGDTVLTAAGAVRPVRWIGRRSYDGAFAARNRALWPVRIRQGALDGALPRRDLWLSPLHALLIEGVLVPARLLANGVSVMQAKPAAELHYVHVELDSHDVLLAEGAPAESFLDDNSRAIFQNAHEYPALYPDAARAPARFCAPLVEDGEALARIKRRIDTLAGIPDDADAPGPLRGSIDRAGPDLVCGWAQDASRPEAPVCLDVLAGGVLVAQVVADRFREDLRRAGLGSGCHAFEAPLPSAAAQPVEVRRSADQAALPHAAHARAA